MKGFFKKAAAFAAASMLTAAMLASNVMAANYTAVTGSASALTFDTYFIVPAGVSVPAASFAYTVAPGSAVSAGSGTMAVLAGVGSPSVSTSTFAAGASTSTDATGKDVARQGRTNVQFDSGESFATATSTVDFSSVSFTEPGIYRYIVSETAATSAETARGIIHDDDADRVLDVYVTDNGSGTLVVLAYLLHEDVGTVAAGSELGSSTSALSDKSTGFTNELSRNSIKDIKFAHAVSGNQASRDKYFDYTLTLSGLTNGDVYTVSLADDRIAETTDGSAEATSGTNAATIAGNQGQTNPTSITIGSDGTAAAHFYLQDGQTVAVRGIPAGAGYALAVNNEDYKSEGASVTDYRDAVSGTLGAVAGDHQAVLTSFTLTRNGVVPTGVFASVGIGALIILIGIIGFIFAMKNRNRASS